MLVAYDVGPRLRVGDPALVVVAAGRRVLIRIHVDANQRAGKHVASPSEEGAPFGVRQSIASRLPAGRNHEPEELLRARLPIERLELALNVVERPAVRLHEMNPLDAADRASFEDVEIAVERVGIPEIARRVDAVVAARIDNRPADGVCVSAI